MKNRESANPGTTPSASTGRVPWLVLLFSAAVLLFAGAISGLLLRACHCDFVSLRYSLGDFNIYANFLWNSAHGEFFKYYVDKSYLQTHLSFTLLLLAPIFRLWDNPFALIIAQWAFPLLGGAIVFASATRHGISLPLRAVLTALLVAYPFAQTPVLGDFHGVALYFLLVPWLYHCLRFNRKWLWLPWLLTLGLREDAALLILPMLLYLDHSRNGRLLALLTALYALLAMFVFFPALSGIDLAQRRSGELSLAHLLASWTPAAIGTRTMSLFWLLLPALPLLRRRWRPVLMFPAAGLAFLLLSAQHKMYGFEVHYPAYVFPLFVAGLLEAVAGEARYRAAAGAAASFRLAGWIFGAVVVAHFAAWRFPVESKANARRLNLSPNPATSSALAAARTIPRTGLLVVATRLSALVVNRADVALLEGKYRRPPDTADAVFLMRANTVGEELLSRLTAAGVFSIRFADERYAVLVRAPATAQGAAAPLPGGLPR